MAMPSLRYFVYGALLSFSLLPAAFAGTISIDSPTTGYTLSEGSSGSSIRRTVGQTFVVPNPTSEDTLTDFAFAFFGTPQVTLDYQAYIFAWDTATSRPTGGALYTSDARTGAQAPSFSGLNVVLTPGTTYVAFLTTQGVPGGNNNDTLGTVALNTTNPYAGGTAVYQSSSTTSTAFTSSAWNVDSGFDMQFSATFVNAVPEPSTWGMFTTALGCLVLLRKRFPSA